ncbi:LacI family DNA-binding transcriptional regulator [Halanaerobacter jeridensis]|uniref:DNA-binding LacI/PurR family transcriptional regulator n=1 Tax=Halanaerobacter jeridensis TaxID=706427 RepID=A0A939BNL1_9FIRM|nr:LacI family DNA-binding transcriptional regulator [Halanaerobacter jeridensis]MBM7555428.1 DNA-binding LacI/PurR family transcriptional regulator [Halanaerobacter jeridensis]
MGVKLKDIAEKLGVSSGTVSKALNDKEGVGHDLRKKIKKAAKEMGYRPNPIAQRLSTNRSNTIGVFMLNRDHIRLKESFGIEIVDGITEQANQAQYDILLFTITKDTYSQRSYLELCRERKVEGAIFISLCLDDPHIEEIKEAEMPVAVIDIKLEGKNLGYITSNNYSGIEQALDYLFEMGHRKIGFIGSCEGAEVSQIRLQAYQDYMQQAGFYDEDYIWRGDFSKESGQQVAEEILSTPDKPTALIAVSDLMALEIMKTLKKAGVAIPEDISIIGFDDIPAARYSDPALTTVAQNGIGLGKEATKFILDSLEGKKTSDAKLLATELVLRESVAER